MQPRQSIDLASRQAAEEHNQGVCAQQSWTECSTVASSCTALCVCLLQAVLLVGFKRAEVDVFKAMMDELDTEVFKVTHTPTRLTTTKASQVL